MPYGNYYQQNPEQQNQQPQVPQPVKNAGNMAKKKVGKSAKKLVQKGIKQLLKMLMKLVMWLVKAILIPLLPYILVILLFAIIIYSAWDLIFNSRGKTQDYQTEDSHEYNNLEQNQETGEIVATDLSFGNKVVKAFYTYFSEQSLWIVCEDEGVNEPLQYNSHDFITKFGENGSKKDFKDKYGREKMFYISPNALWSLDEFLNKGQFRFPEQFVKPVYNEGKDKDYALKHLTNDKGELVAESTKYVDNADKTFKVPKKGETEKGVWDYGFGSILHYKKFEEEAKKVGSYTEIQVWDIEAQKPVYKTVDEAKKGVAEGRYEGFKDYSGKTYEAEIPSANKTSYMIDRVTSPAGSITNEIVQEWEDSGEAFATTEKRTETVTEKYIDVEKEKKHVELKHGESVKKEAYINVKGEVTKTQTVKFTCKNEAHFDENGKHTHTNETKKVSYEVEVEKEKTRPMQQDLEVRIEGTIHRFIPRYTGNPDTSQITGDRYYQDYIRNYSTYAPESVLTQFDFKSMRDRTGKDEEALLRLLERESFGGAGGSSSNANLSDFEIGSGANGSGFKKAMEHFPLFEKYGNMYGIDPYILVALAVGESSGNHENYISSARCAKAGCGIMQIEKPGISGGITKATAYNFDTKSMETIDVTYSKAINIETNIQIGAMLAASRVAKENYNILMGFQSYNFGEGAFGHVVKAYANATGRTVEEIKNNPGDLGWIPYVQEVHQNPTKYFSWTGNIGHVCKIPECTAQGGTNHYGSPAYVERFLKNYTSPNPEGMWVLKQDGTKVSLALDGTVTISTGNIGGSGGGNFMSWLKNIWTSIKEGWETLFPSLPKELSPERRLFSNKVPEEQIDTIIKMMFVMEERKYLTEYDDMTEDEWKEKFATLFSNPLGSNWSSSGNGNGDLVDSTQYFPDGFDVPLDISPLTIAKPYGSGHSGVDIVAPKGTTVKAIADGEVVEVGDNSSKGGKFIKIKHKEGVYTLYGNLDTASVKTGDKVTKGQSIGTTGTKEGNVLHLELLKGDTNEDPTWIVTGTFNAGDYNMSEADAQIVSQMISLGKSKVGGHYTWGGKGEIMTQAGINSLVAQYGMSYYPYGKSFYVGKFSVDCSGYVGWMYKQVTGIYIGGGTSDQQERLKAYKIKGFSSVKDVALLQPGDLLYRNTNGRHVAMYIGNGRIIHSSSPTRGILEENLSGKTFDTAIRAMGYVNSKKGSN